MNSNRLNLQIFSIFAIIISAFVGSAVFSSFLNTESVKHSVETETKISSVILSSAIRYDIPEYLTESEADGNLVKRLTRVLTRIKQEVGENVDVWIVDASFRVLYEDIADGGSELAELTQGIPQQKLIPAESKSEHEDGRAVYFWIGKNGLLIFNQKLLMVRSVFDGRLYLVMCNRAESVHAMQRRQFALFAGIEIVLMLTMFVFLANTLFSYRKQLIRLATKDELTGLSNRKSFNEAYRDYVRNTVQDKRELFTVFLMDIDYFKRINDTYGHAAGDLALRTLAGYIGRMTERLGGFAGRWGGDEFIGVLPLEGGEAEKELRRLCGEIKAERMEGGFGITISAGAVQASRTGSPELARLTELADLALYASKEGGRDRATLYSKALEPVSEAPAKEEKAVAPAAAAEGAEQTAASAGRGAAGEKPEASARKRENFKARLKAFVRDRLVESILLGVKWMAPFVAGGGLLIGLAFLFDAWSVDLSTLSVADRTKLGSITPLAASLKSIGDSTFNFMLPVFAGFMAYGLAGESAFLAGFVGGFMTIQCNAGFIGAMAAGLMAGLIAYEINEFIGRTPRYIQKAAPIVIFPVFNLLLIHVMAVLVITPVFSSIGKIFFSFLDGLRDLDPNIMCAAAGGMMAFDMGGVVNKVAYNYGVSSLASGETCLMASVMAGGMVPPVGIALAMIAFKNKFTPTERERLPGTLFMGLSFITEGALPFVFSDVFRVIPSCMAGSALAGLLSSLFGCRLPAPHGGIFVLPVMTHPILYLLALAAGSAVTALLLGYLKKPFGSGKDS
ncbi:MAG: fructose-specific PTS transporter subunit EIIC [Lachnospiraceae bacterium]|nr:fructose-specific PTS transporter subunit EIIC [Lachnospiraceae bacterium]